MSVSGLTTKHVLRARSMAVEAAALGLTHAARVHYTQGTRRWDGINKDLKAWRGEYPKYADCSAYVTWCLWNGLDHYHARDHVNGLDWRSGYTGTLLEHGTLVTGPVQQADLVIYGHGWPGEHVAICVGGGLVISHGSENGPYKLPIRYRPDVFQVRRYI